MSLFDKFLSKMKTIKHMKKIQLLWEERGDILVLTALLLPIMFGCLGIAYDLGNIYIHKARLQNVTDAAALAGGRAYLQSQLKTGESVHKDTYDSYTNGNVTDEEYVIGGSKTRSGYHPDADKAADDYIYKNIVNLGEKVYSDKFSHYALPGLKKNGEDYINAEKIFYRIGLYEIVPLHFLPVITKKKFETVRAGSVVVVEQGTTSVIPGGDDTTTSYSIFDNLFTYSEVFWSRHTSSENDENIPANNNSFVGFEGDMVYTHGNGNLSDYYDHQDNYKSRHLYEYAGLVSSNKINDPVIDTTYSTLDYLDALTTEKLKQTHNLVNKDTNNQPIKVIKASDLNDANSNIFITEIKGPDGETVWKGRTNNTPYIYQDNEYYAVDSSGNYVYVDGKKVCYQRIGDVNNSHDYMPCIKDNGKYYVLTATNTKSDYYLETNNGATALCKDGNTFNYYRNGKYYNIDSYGNRFIYENGEYYEVDENGNKKQANGGKYICYRAFGDQYLRCVKGDDGRYYLLQGNSQSHCYITNDGSVYYDGLIPGIHLTDTKLLYDESSKKFYYNGLTGRRNFDVDAPINANFQTLQGDLSAAITDDFSNRQPQDIYKSRMYTNIFYVNNNNNIEIIIDDKVTGVDEIAGGEEKRQYTPIYIIIDPSVDRTNILVEEGKRNERPIIIIDTGTNQIDFQIKNGATFDGVIYAPYASGGVHLKSSGGNFNGNIITHTIDMQEEAGGSHWKVTNYLENENYTDSYVAQVTEDVRNANMNNSFSALSQEIKDDILDTLGIEESNLGDRNWFNQKSWNEKQEFYRKWKVLYNRYKTNDAARNVLWPWNQHFKTEGSTTTTGETLRLINYRTEFQLKENLGNDDVVDPFIFETLGKPNSY